MINTEGRHPGVAEIVRWLDLTPEVTMINTEGRHPGVAEIVRWLDPNPALPQRAVDVAIRIEQLAAYVIEHTTDGPELTAGLRKLVEAKDCLVRAVL